MDNYIERKVNKKGVRPMDRMLIMVIILLLAFGLIMIYSASSYQAFIHQNGNSSYYFDHQLLATIIGLIAMFTVGGFIDYHQFVDNFKINRIRIPIPTSIIMTALATICIILIIPFGKTINGARRWLIIKGLGSFQPAEFAKLAVILITCWLLENMSAENREKLNGMKIVLAPGFVLSLLILFITKNLSSAVIIFLIPVGMLFVAVKNYRYFVKTAAAILALGGIGIAFIYFNLIPLPEKIGFRLARIKAWLDPKPYASGKSYQTLQGLYAIGAGGIMGKGPGQSIQKLSALPEPQNDMIFSIICEELGFIGAVAIMLLFLALIWKFLQVADNAPDFSGTMLATGTLVHIAIQVIFNIAVVTNTMPNTGVTLPMISYGGTSIVFTLLEFGIVLNISKEIPIENNRTEKTS